MIDITSVMDKSGTDVAVRVLMGSSVFGVCFSHHAYNLPYKPFLTLLTKKNGFVNLIKEKNDKCRCCGLEVVLVTIIFC